MAVLVNGVKGKKVAVAMSGGVDSSVCAWMLKQSGADVFGITMSTIAGSKCCAPSDIEEARLVCKDLGITHVVVDLKKEFEKQVIDYFARESLKGKTPNPCVPCNQNIKFGLLVKAAENLGAELFATGHYARLNKKKDGKTGKMKIVLKRPIDIKKDQSYVLSMLPRKTFERVIFPIGDYTKEQIRAIAKKNKLRVFDKQENQDLCFLHKEKGDFIKEWTGKKFKRGDIRDSKGKLLGKHKGLAHYNIGQRHGLGIQSHERYYVKEILPEKNQLVAGTEQELFKKELIVSGANWVSIDAPEKPLRCEVLIRNKTEPKKVRVIPYGRKLKVVPEDPLWAISPGQIAVFIKKDVVLGGGWIE